MKLLEQLTKATDEMLSAATAGDLDQVNTQLDLRAALLEELRAMGLDLASPATVPCLEQVRQRTAEIEQLLAESRSEIVRELEAVSAATGMLGAYLVPDAPGPTLDVRL